MVCECFACAIVLHGKQSKDRRMVGDITETASLSVDSTEELRRYATQAFTALYYGPLSDSSRMAWASLLGLALHEAHRLRMEDEELEGLVRAMAHHRMTDTHPSTPDWGEVLLADPEFRVLIGLRAL